jgi:hypothetical protein
MGMSDHLKVPGFAAELAPTQSRGQYGNVSYAWALNQASSSATARFEAAPSAPKRLRQDPHETVTHSFPSIEVVRRVDQSRAGSDLTKFEAKLKTVGRKLGLRALDLSEMQVILIKNETFNAAMTQRYDYAARQPIYQPGTRTKAAKETVQHTRDYLADVTRDHHSSLRELTCGESRDVTTRIAARMEDPEYFRWLQETQDDVERPDDYDDTLLAAYDMADLPGNPDGVLHKAYSLWQPYTAEIDDFSTNGPQAFGVVLNDDLGVLNTEAGMIGAGLAEKSRSDFNRAHFHVGKSIRWKLTLLESDNHFISDYDELHLPSCPVDWPLTAPIVVSEVR